MYNVSMNQLNPGTCNINTSVWDTNGHTSCLNPGTAYHVMICQKVSQTC